MSWRVPARPREAASTAARRTSTPLPMVTPPKLSLATRRSWRSSLQIWIKPWRRCEMGFWRGGPTADEPRASPTHPLLLCPRHLLPAWVTSLRAALLHAGKGSARGQRGLMRPWDGQLRRWPDLALLPHEGASTERGQALTGVTRLCPARGAGGSWD